MASSPVRERSRTRGGRPVALLLDASPADAVVITAIVATRAKSASSAARRGVIERLENMTISFLGAAGGHRLVERPDGSVLLGNPPKRLQDAPLPVTATCSPDCETPLSEHAVRAPRRCGLHRYRESGADRRPPTVFGDGDGDGDDDRRWDAALLDQQPEQARASTTRVAMARRHRSVPITIIAGPSAEQSGREGRPAPSAGAASSSDGAEEACGAETVTLGSAPFERAGGEEATNDRPQRPVRPSTQPIPTKLCPTAPLPRDHPNRHDQRTRAHRRPPVAATDRDDHHLDWMILSDRDLWADHCNVIRVSRWSE